MQFNLKFNHIPSISPHKNINVEEYEEHDQRFYPKFQWMKYEKLLSYTSSVTTRKFAIFNSWICRKKYFPRLSDRWEPLLKTMSNFFFSTAYVTIEKCDSPLSTVIKRRNIIKNHWNICYLEINFNSLKPLK